MTNENPDAKLKVLIIDDDTFLLDMYSIKFTESGFNVSTATSCTDALAKLTGGYKPDIMLVDIVMPGMDGIDFLKEARSRNLCEATHIIILSNLGQKEDIERGMSCGAQDYIVKANFTPSQVVARVRELVTRQTESTPH